MAKVDVGTLRKQIGAMKGNRAEVSKAWLSVVCDELDELEKLRQREAGRADTNAMFDNFFNQGRQR